ncbi:hypothetical protein K439DRAFT_1615904 [Ramaria rubella]|nr:hypothetical protein K439DRAFT_1615904 [Ramaria rubella]
MPMRITSPRIITMPVASDSRSQKSKLRSSLDELREPPTSDTDDSPGVRMLQLPHVQKHRRPQSSPSQAGTMEQGLARQEEETRRYERTTGHIAQMITALKESHKCVDTTHETLGDGMELLIQSLEEEVQGPLRGKAPERGNNPNRDREVDHEAEKARRKRDRQRMPPAAGPSTRSGPQEPSAMIEQDNVSMRRRTEEETDRELEARNRENIRKGICRSKRTYNEQEVLKAVTQQSLREMMKSDANSVSTTTSTHVSLEHEFDHWDRIEHKAA